MKKIFRYKEISLWLILGFAIAFVVFDYIGQARLLRYNEDSAFKESKLKLGYYMRIEPVGDDVNYDLTSYLHTFFMELCNEGVRLKTDDFYANTEPEISFILACDICISHTAPQYPLYKGEYPTKEQLMSGNGYAVISYSRKNDVYLKDGGEYINFNGEEFQVTGYLSKYSDWLVNNGLLLFAGDNTEALWNLMAGYLEKGYLNVSMESDGTHNFSEQVDEINSLAMKISDGKICVKYIERSNVGALKDIRMEYSNVPSENQRKYATYAYFFVIVTLCCVIEYWIILRKKEFEIRKKVGYSLLNILSLIYGNIFMLGVIGAIFGKVVVCIMICVFDGYLTVSIPLIYSNFIIMVFYLFVTIVLATVLPVTRLVLNNIIKKEK